VPAAAVVAATAVAATAAAAVAALRPVASGSTAGSRASVSGSAMCTHISYMIVHIIKQYIAYYIILCSPVLHHSMLYDGLLYHSISYIIVSCITRTIYIYVYHMCRMYGIRYNIRSIVYDISYMTYPIIYNLPCVLIFGHRRVWGCRRIACAVGLQRPCRAR